MCQFTSEEEKLTLKNFIDVPDVYPIGRLDYDSEGLLIITNDKKLNHLLLNPTFAHEREYWVQVDGAVTKEAIEQLQKGVEINVDGKLYKTKPCKAQIFDEEPIVADRNPPIRFRKNIPTTWVKLILSEGKNRQVRKMTAKVGFPTLRLIRHRIKNCTLENLQPGEIKMVTQKEITTLLFV